MKTKNSKFLSPQAESELLSLLKFRFEKHKHRHKNVNWDKVEAQLLKQKEKLYALNEMEKSGGEPDVIQFEAKKTELVFCDCSSESPKGRRSLCYDREALESRKQNKPINCAVELANEMGVSLLTEEEYRSLQELEAFDTKTSSWIQTPEEVRELGGALFCDYRFGKVFVYHNGAESYYASRGFRALIRI